MSDIPLSYWIVYFVDGGSIRLTDEQKQSLLAARVGRIDWWFGKDVFEDAFECAPKNVTSAVWSSPEVRSKVRQFDLDLKAEEGFI